MRRALLLGRRAQRGWLRQGARVSFTLRPLVVAGAAVSVLVVGLQLRPRAHAPVAIQTAAHPDPAPQRDVLVRFALPAPEAREVYLTGDFNGWSLERTPLRRTADGVWTTTVPLPAGTFQYAYVVDGRFVQDPLAETYRPDGFGGMNAVLRVTASADPG